MYTLSRHAIALVLVCMNENSLAMGFCILHTSTSLWHVTIFLSEATPASLYLCWGLLSISFSTQLKSPMMQRFLFSFVLTMVATFLKKSYFSLSLFGA